MNLFDLIIFFLGLILGIILLVGVIIHLVKNRNDKKVLKTIGLRTLGLAALITIPILFVKSDLGKDLRSDYNFNRYTTLDIDFNDSTSYDAHYCNVSSFKSLIDSRTRHVNRPASSFIEEDGSQSIITEFEGYKNSEDSVYQDIGHLFLALHYINLEQSQLKIKGELNEVNDISIPYYNFVKGACDFNARAWDKYESAEANLLQSIAEEECVPESYKKLSRLYYYFHEKSKLDALIANPETTNFVPDGLKRIQFMDSNSWGKYWEVIFQSELDYWHFFGVVSAIILLLLWLFYLRKLDIYEPEKKRYLILTFIISVVSMQLLYPMHDVLWHIFGYHRPLTPISDLWYCVISIGMIEEFVKILPVLLILKFTKQINEPFDYILYASVSALGFAFIENIGYFGESITSVGGRGIYCCIAHMAFSATIGYGLMLAKYRGYNKYLLFILFFLLASFLHGFYDFWIINWWASEYGWMSDLTFILCMYLFAYFINNTLNNSTFYDRRISLKADQLKYIGIMICVAILMTGYVAVSFVYWPEYAQEYLIGRSSYLGFYIFFFVLSMGSMKIIRGYISPLTLPLRNLFKQKKSLRDMSGHNLELTASAKFNIESELLHDKKSLEQEVTLKERLVIDDNLKSYVIELKSPLDIEEYENDILIAVPHWDLGSFKSRQRVLTNLFLIKDKSDLDKPFLNEEDFTYLGKVFSKRT